MSKKASRTETALFESLEARVLLSTYYIATTGSNTAAGTLAAPFANLGEFFAVAKPGDTCNIEGGTYNGTASGWANLKPGVSGTASAPITVQNYNGQLVTIDTGQSAANSTDFIELENGESYLNFSGLTLDRFATSFMIQGSTSHINISNININYAGNYAAASQDGWGMFFGNGANNITVNHCVIDYVSGSGIQVDYTNNVTIENTQVHDTNGGSGSDGITGDLDTSSRYSTNLTLLNDTVWNIGDDGFDIKADYVTETNCTAYDIYGDGNGSGGIGFKTWSPRLSSAPNNVSFVQGHFVLTDCIGYNCVESVIRAFNSPALTLTNCSFMGTGVGESTFIYDAGQTWTGALTMSGDKFYYNGTTSYAWCADVDKNNVTISMDGDQYYNSMNASQAFVMRVGTTSDVTFANAAFNNGSFYAAEGQELHGLGVQNDIAPFLVTSSIPSAATAGVATAFSATALSPEGKAVTCTWSFGDGTAPVSGPSVNHTFAGNGTYEVVLTMSDGTAQTVLDPTVTVTGGSGLLPPVATNDSAKTNVNAPVTTPNVLAGDSDPNGQTISVTAFTQAAHGTVVNNGNGTFTYTPATNWLGTDTFTYTISDTSGLTATAIVTITISPLPPVTKSASATTNENTAVTTPNVLAGDSDPNGQTLSITAFTQAAHGTVVNNGNGTFTYTPANNWTGTDAFTYTVTDTSGLTATGAVNVTVTASLLPPVATNDSATTAVNKAVVTPNVLTNDSDPNGEALSVTAFTQAAHGTVVNNGNGTFTYTPGSNWLGTDTFTYTITDTSGLAATATVTVTVTPLAPVATNDSAKTNVNTAVITPNVLTGDSDPNGEALSVTAFTQAAHGTVVNNSNGTFTYTPASNWTGTDSFTYTISDTSGLTATATVTVTVSGNLQPPVAKNASATTTVNKVVITGNVLTADSDPNGQTLSMKSFTQGAHGAVAYNSNGTFTYTPASNWTGTDSFTYTIADTSGLTATASVTVTVSGSLLPPVVKPVSAATTMNKAVTTANVLIGDTDPNGATLSVKTYGQASHGKVVNNRNGTFTYTPANNWTGTDSFKVTIADTCGMSSLATVTVVVSSTAALPPVAANDSAKTNVNTAVTTANVLANDSDPNGQTLSISAFTQAAHGTVVNNGNGTFTYKPATNWTGTDAFTYTVKDTSGLTATATVTVTVLPLSPVATNDSATTFMNTAVTTTNVLANDSDPNGQTLTVSAFTQAAHGTVVNNGNGTFTYTPASNWTGADAFTYTVKDTSGLTATATVTVTVSSTPLPPVAKGVSVTTNENTAVTTPNVLANDSDPNGETLSISAVTQGAHGTVVNNGNGTFTYTPASNWSGADAFTYTIKDTSGLTATASIGVTVNPVTTSGTSYYIATNGSDSNPGTLAAPFATLGHFLAMAKPGYTAYIEGGTYNGSASGWANLKPNVSGTASAPITVQNYNGQLVTIDTGQSAANSTDFIELVNGESYLNFSGLTLDHFAISFYIQGNTPASHINISNININYAGNYAAASQDGWGMFFGNGANNITVNHCVIDYVSGAGIQVDYTNNVTIENTQIHDTNGGSGSDGICGDLDTSSRYSTNLTLLNDTVWNSGDDGFDIKAVGVTETNCVAYDIYGPNGSGGIAFKCWSPRLSSAPNNVSFVQGSFVLTNCIGYNATESVIRAFNSPALTLTNCSFMGTGVGESTFIYNAGQTWTGDLTMSGDKFYYNGTTGYAWCADVDKNNVNISMDGDQYYNSMNASQAFVMRNGSSDVTFANAAFNNGSFYAAEGQELHGLGVQNDIAPFAASCTMPAAGACNTATAFCATALSPEGSAVTCTWSFGDGTAPVSGASVTHAFTAAGTYTVTLTLSDGTMTTTLVEAITVA